MSEAHDDGSLRQAVARKGSLVQTIQAVAWSFFGVRRGSENEKAMSQLNPLHVVIAGVIGAALFVLVLVLLVKFVLGSGIAA